MIQIDTHVMCARCGLMMCLSLVLLLFSGCSGCNKKAPGIVESPAADAALEAEPELTPHDRALALFDEVLAECEVTKLSRIKNCQGDQMLRFNALLREHTEETLPVIVSGLMDKKDVPRQHLSVSLLRDAVWPQTHTLDTEKISEGDVRVLLDVLGRESAVTSFISLPTIKPVIALALQKEMAEEARALLRYYDPTGSTAAMWVHIEGVKGYASVARLDAMDLMTALAADERVDMKIGALEAALEIKSWAPDEADALCAWVSGYIKGDDEQWKGKPAQVMLRCAHDRAKWFPLLMDEAERREKLGLYGRPFADAVRYICPRLPGLEAREDALCERQYALFLRVARDKRKSTGERSFAIGVLGDRWLDDSSLTALAPLTQDADPKVASVAQSTIERAERIRQGQQAERERLERGEPLEGEEPTPPAEPGDAPSPSPE